jgi:hypothetical protein
VTALSPEGAASTKLVPLRCGSGWVGRRRWRRAHLAQAAGGTREIEIERLRRLLDRDVARRVADFEPEEDLWRGVAAGLPGIVADVLHIGGDRRPGTFGGRAVEQPHGAVRDVVVLG